VIAAKWHEHWKGGNGAHHVKATWSRLEANVFPGIGDRLITEIEAPEIVEMVKAIQDRGKLDIAKRALETTGQIFRYAVAHGLAQRNPASEIKRVTFSSPGRKRTMPVWMPRSFRHS
jgi:integrase